MSRIAQTCLGVGMADRVPERPYASAGSDARPSWWAEQDDVIMAISDGEPLPTSKLRELPPWRAHMLALIGARCGLGLEDGTIEQLRDEARRVGGSGRLGQWWQQ